jgi:putative zinc finger/helix-turn-helix YgiT family protein
MKTCVECGSDKLQEADVQIERSIAGALFLTTASATRCGACGEEYVAGEAVQKFELSIASYLALAGVHSGEVFRFMRKAIGMRAADLADLLGVAPETVSRWENDEREPERGLFGVLGALIGDKIAGRTTVLDMLRAQRNPKPLGKQIKIPVAA